MEKIIGEKLKVYRADDIRSQAYHFHNGYELIFIEKGGSEFNINDNALPYQQHDIIFINQMEKHQMRPLTKEYIRYVAIFDPEYFDRFINNPVLCSIFKQRPANFQNGFHLPPETAAFILPLLQSCVSEYNEQKPFYKETIMSMISLLLIHLNRNFPLQFPAARLNTAETNAFSIQGYLDKNYLENVSIDLIANEFHLNKYYIMEFFKEITGYTIKQYILLKRISYAKNLLYYSSKSISDIALDSGFNSVSNFIRAFNKHENMTPLGFRKMNDRLKQGHHHS